VTTRSSQRRLVAALDGFARHRKAGVRAKRHIVPLVEFAAAELRSRGVRSSTIRYEALAGHFYQRKVDLLVEVNGEVALTLLVLTQSGSVRKNLNNRRRDVVGDAVNMRAAHPNAVVALLYVLRADEEATRKGTSGASPVDELVAFLIDLQTGDSPLGRPLLDAAALLAADSEPGGRIRIEPTHPDVDVLGAFFDKLVATIRGLEEDVRAN
jgi:hypothetical protein